ncbi:hypothetical protein [Falsiroseomonas selenitidurans]|uniref:Uncharacterized protein n=1 Tax=Falsiroseomonas selenitidurans TaxID=2716335 RepID=A0ABX1E690_9PROT|nr:hypothetical protein [Falsiroseomonas selenitidurans]NKC32591.1 hypothetical protein [Falsiroseomonas selenitidurans]
MRRLALLTLPLGLLLAQPVGLFSARPAAAQHWNDTGPGRDLLGSTITDFSNFRERTVAPPSFAPGAPVAQPQAQRDPIPLLDWVPPPPVPAAAPSTTRRSPPRRTVRRAPVQRDVARDTTPLTAAAPRSTTQAGPDWERSIAERERELERLRRILEEDRLRYQQTRQPQLQ